MRIALGLQDGVDLGAAYESVRAILVAERLKRARATGMAAFVDKLLEEAAAKGVDDPDRVGFAQKAQRLFREDWMYIPYYYDVMSKWAMPWVQNFDKNDDWQVIEPWNVTIDEEKRP